MRDPFVIIKRRYNTEKTNVLAQLEKNESNASLKKCKTPKIVFLVDVGANKEEIAWAVEAIYSKKGIKVTAVNTIKVKPKEKRMRGRIGFTAAFKKAIVSLRPGDNIEEVS